MKKRILVALFAGATVFGLALAFAASLTLSSDQLQAGDQAVGKCQVASLNVSYTTSYVTAAPAGYKVTAATVSPVDAACVNKKLAVAFTDSTGAVLFQSAATNITAAGPVNFTITPNVLASAVTDAHALIAS